MKVCRPPSWREFGLRHLWTAKAKCLVTKKAGLQPVTILKNDPQAVIDFIRCLPDSWSCGPRTRASLLIPDDKNQGRFAHQLEISNGNCPIVFTCYFTAGFDQIALYTNVEMVKGYEGTVDGCSFEWVPLKKKLKIKLPRRPREQWPRWHPIVEICRWALSPHNLPLVKPYVQRWFPDAVIDEWFRSQAEHAAYQDLKRELERLCTGWTRFLFRRGGRFGLQPLGTGKDKEDQLFGLTWIFPWAPSILRDIRPNCMILDGTFESIRPYTLEILEAVIANEAIPIALSLAPTETEESYSRLYEHLADVLDIDNHPGTGAALLKSIPLLSDQGKGLKSFVQKQKLYWVHCHRHLIENAGASSIGGDWVRRLLNCGDLDEARQVAAVIRVELQAMQHRRQTLFRYAHCHNTLDEMLTAVEQDSDALNVWARWRRFGCPTTSNAGEAIHMVLNLCTRQCQSFFSRLAAVKEVLFRRFNDRNEEARIKNRAVNRWFSEAKLKQMTPANYRYYVCLHTFLRDRTFAGRDWRFPDVQVATEFTDPEWIFVESTPPDSWGHADPEPAADVPPDSDQAEQDKSDQLPRGTATYRHTGWEIIRSVKLISKAGKAQHKRIASVVWSRGALLALVDLDCFPPDKEVDWRMGVYDELGIFG
jgi:hypothetical protein